MVAMGSSFADGAWDRETAVYRISGVLTVISGWFITALCASTMAAVVCWLTYGYIDDVIEPRNTRFRIIRALQSLATKRLQNPAKKHSNIPL